MHEPSALVELRRHRLISVIRAPSPAAALGAARAVAAGGLPIIEVTFSVPQAPSVMAELAAEPGLVVGAGTVLTPQQARASLDAGAKFIVAPNLSHDVARVALEAGVMYCPGAYTTTEIVTARSAGAHIIKVYPVGVAGGPDYIRIIRDPLPDIPYLAAGGTNLDNIGPFFAAGCVACGIGGTMADPALATAGNFAEITRRTRAFVARVAEFTESRTAGPA